MWVAMMVGKIRITKTEYESLGGLKQKRLGLGLCEIEFTVWRASWKDPFRTTLFDGDWLESLIGVAYQYGYGPLPDCYKMSFAEHNAML